MEGKLKRLRRPSKQGAFLRAKNCDRCLQVAQDEPLWKAKEGTVFAVCELIQGLKLETLLAGLRPGSFYFIPYFHYFLFTNNFLLSS